MSGVDQEQALAMEHDEYMGLHRANARLAERGPSAKARLQLLDTVTETELESEVAGLTNLNARDFTLSFYDEKTDTHEFKFLQEIVSAFSNSCYPHPRSGSQGLAREWASGVPGDRLEARNSDEIATDESFLMGTFSRAKRGEGGMQQDALAKQIVETHAYREGSATGGHGILRRIRRDRKADERAPPEVRAP